MGRQGNIPFPGGPLLGDEWSHVNEPTWTFSFPSLSWTPELYQSWKLFSWAYCLFCSCLSMYRFQLGPTENHWNVVRNADPRDSVLTWSSYILMRAPVLKRFSACFAGQKESEETLSPWCTYIKHNLQAAAGRILVFLIYQIKTMAGLGWKGNCFVCLTLFPQFLYPSITVNKKGNKKITIDLFSLLSSIKDNWEKGLAYHKSNQNFQLGQWDSGVDYKNLHTLELHVHTETQCWEPKVGESI